MKPRAGHTSMTKGAKVIAFMRDGSHIIGRFIESKGRFVILDTARIRTNELRQLAYFKGGNA